MKLLNLSPAEKVKLLTELIAFPGWHLFCEMVKESEIKPCKKKLEEGDHSDLGEVSFLQHKIRFARSMLDLPRMAIDDGFGEENKKDEKGVESLDPYFHSEAEIKAEQKREMQKIEIGVEEDHDDDL